MEKTCSSNPNELLLYPGKDQSAPCSPPPLSNSTCSPAPPTTSSHTPPDQPPQPLAQPRPPSTPLSRSGSGSPQSPPSSPCSSSSSSPPALSQDLRQKLEELLVKYSSGLWAHALPKLFQDAYKVSKTLTDSLAKFTPQRFFLFCLTPTSDKTARLRPGKPPPARRHLHSRLPDGRQPQEGHPVQAEQRGGSGGRELQQERQLHQRGGAENEEGCREEAQQPGSASSADPKGGIPLCAGDRSHQHQRSGTPVSRTAESLRLDAQTLTFPHPPPQVRW